MSEESEKTFFQYWPVETKQALADMSIELLEFVLRPESKAEQKERKKAHRARRHIAFGRTRTRQLISTFGETDVSDGPGEILLRCWDPCNDVEKRDAILRADIARFERFEAPDAQDSSREAEIKRAWSAAIVQAFIRAARKVYGIPDDYPIIAAEQKVA